MIPLLLLLIAYALWSRNSLFSSLINFLEMPKKLRYSGELFSFSAKLLYAYTVLGF